MTDIVERLREHELRDYRTMDEAADEIERLRKIQKVAQEQCAMLFNDNVRLSDGIKLNADLRADLDRCHRAIADLQAEVRRKSEEIERLRLCGEASSASD